MLVLMNVLFGPLSGFTQSYTDKNNNYYLSLTINYHTYLLSTPDGRRVGCQILDYHQRSTPASHRMTGSWQLAATDIHTFISRAGGN